MTHSHPDFEGSLVLEKLAEIGQLDAFYEAVDADDVPRASALLRRAGLDAASIATVLREIADPGGEP